MRGHHVVTENMKAGWDPTEVRSADVLIVAVKAKDTPEALASVSHLVGQGRVGAVVAEHDHQRRCARRAIRLGGDRRRSHDRGGRDRTPGHVHNAMTVPVTLYLGERMRRDESATCRRSSTPSTAPVSVPRPPRTSSRCSGRSWPRSASRTPSRSLRLRASRAQGCRMRRGSVRGQSIYAEPRGRGPGCLLRDGLRTAGLLRPARTLEGVGGGRPGSGRGPDPRSRRGDSAMRSRARRCGAHSSVTWSEGARPKRSRSSCRSSRKQETGFGCRGLACRLPQHPSDRSPRRTPRRTRSAEPLINTNAECQR